MQAREETNLLPLERLVKEVERKCDQCCVTLSDPWIEVDTKKQALFLRSRDGTSIKHYLISTAKEGLGQRSNTFKTPLGLHKISKRIGANVPLYTVFVAKKKTGEICRPGEQRDRRDYITSRILVLDGLEEGFNRGKDRAGHLVDSNKRLVYIHGTPYETELGRPVSHGCIRMAGAEILVLFDLVDEGTLVWIH